MSSLHIAGVRAAYRDVEVLHGVDLDVPSGTTTAILGPSGCGKTTLLRIVAGFLAPGSGSVSIGDREVVGARTWVPPERRGIGYVAQEGALFPHLSVADNIGFGLDRGARRDGRRIGELLELVGLPTTLGARSPDQLSGGQQQRVALARALARRPGVVLLDEPFSSLDAGLRASTRRAVAEALAAEGVTVVLVTHDQGEALSFAGQVAIMRDGRFAQVGTPAEVYTHPVDLASAAFLGDVIVLPGRIADGVVHTVLGTADLPGDTWDPPNGLPVDACEVAVRPEHLRLLTDPGERAFGPAESANRATADVESVGGPVADVASGGGAVAEVESVDYFGHDALVALRLRGADPRVVLARISGVTPPAVGSVVGVALDGPVRVFPPTTP